MYSARNNQSTNVFQRARAHKPTMSSAQNDTAPLAKTSEPRGRIERTHRMSQRKQPNAPAVGDKRQSVHPDWAGPKHNAEMDHKGVAPARAAARDPLQSPQNPELRSDCIVVSSAPPRVHIEKLLGAERPPILKKRRRRAGLRRGGVWARGLPRRAQAAALHVRSRYSTCGSTRHVRAICVKADRQ